MDPLLAVLWNFGLCRVGVWIFVPSLRPGLFGFISLSAAAVCWLTWYPAQTTSFSLLCPTHRVKFISLSQALFSCKQWCVFARKFIFTFFHSDAFIRIDLYVTIMKAETIAQHIINSYSIPHFSNTTLLLQWGVQC